MGFGGNSPKSEVPLYLQMSETHILIRLLRMYFPRNWEFGSALSKLLNFRVGWLKPQTPPLVCHCSVVHSGVMGTSNFKQQFFLSYQHAL
jgi:hypothetical protein